MMTYIKFGLIALVAGFVGAGAFVLFHPSDSSSGNYGAINNATSTITNPFAFTQGLSVGATQSTSNKVSGLNFGTCNIQANANTIAASTTKTVDCSAGVGTAPGTALAGITAGDRVFISQPTTTPTTSNGLVVTGASASSTTGFITLTISNLTGTTFTWTAAASSSWPYFVLR